jgi:hypothetical protein
MSETHRLFAELEATLTNGSGPQRFTILRKITDLFLSEVDAYSDDHVAVFDGLMSQLIDRIEKEALAELSIRLAPIHRAPANVIGALSHNDDIEVAGPVLRQSPVLTDADLVTIATTKSQAHLSAIASRLSITEPVTDVLIDRGNAEVAHKVTANPRARLSRFGFSKAVTRAAGDDSLALAVVARLDLPDDLLQQLVGRASMTVRQRLLANAPPEMRQRINHVLATVSERVVREEVPPGANMTPEMRQDPVKLRARIVECAESRNLPELLDALAVLSDIPIKAIKEMATLGSDEGMLVLGKSCGFGWHDLHKIMAAMCPGKRTPEEINALFTSYTALSVETAQRAVRFIQTSRSKLANEMRKLAAVAG